MSPGPFPVGGTFATDSVRLVFTGGSVTVPSAFPPTDSEDLYTLIEPFTMSGHWTVEVAAPAGPVLFDRDVFARGRVRLVLGADRTTGNSIIYQAIYEFEDTAPIPEPATLTLVAFGGAALIARRRLGGRRARDQA